jgi:signal transduction histidine kinase
LDRDPEEARRSLDKLCHLIGAASAEMRTLLLELRPATLVENDLAFLLEYLSRVTTDRTGIPVEATIDRAHQPEIDLKIALYRIAQEALNNVAKHAGAGRVELSLRCGEGGIELSIGDDGCGFDPEALPPGRLGVKIMHERAAEVGARLTIDSEPGQGTRLRVVWERERSAQ